MSKSASLMPAMQISASGLEAQARRMEVIANNVANAGATRGEDGKVFRRKEVVFSAKLEKAMENGKTTTKPKGVEIKAVVEDQSPLKKVYRPGHPDADKDGYLTMPNVNILEEMVDMMATTRAYEANLAAMKSCREMAGQALRIGK